MPRYDRTRFFLFGLLVAINVIVMALYGLDLSTSGSGGAAHALPVLIVLMGFCLLTTIPAAIKRGRDVGWPAWLSLLAFVMSGPFLLLFIAYFAFAKARPSAEEFGPAAPPATAITWSWALVNLVWPWVVFAFVAALN